MIGETHILMKEIFESLNKSQLVQNLDSGVYEHLICEEFPISTDEKLHNLDLQLKSNVFLKNELVSYLI